MKIIFEWAVVIYFGIVLLMFLALIIAGLRSKNDNSFVPDDEYNEFISYLNERKNKKSKNKSGEA